MVEQRSTTYIYELVDNGAAMRIGIERGDIVIGYSDRSIKGMDDLVSALRDAPAGEPVRITLLRMQADGNFMQHMKTVVAGSLGAGFMPI
jgi:S1-C subfamily serine protease